MVTQVTVDETTLDRLVTGIDESGEPLHGVDPRCPPLLKERCLFVGQDRDMNLASDPLLFLVHVGGKRLLDELRAQGLEPVNLPNSFLFGLESLIRVQAQWLLRHAANCFERRLVLVQSDFDL